MLLQPRTIRMFMDARKVQLAYVTKHGPLLDGTEGGRYFPSSPLKFAVRMGLVEQYLTALQAATASDTPFDFDKFARAFAGSAR